MLKNLELSLTQAWYQPKSRLRWLRPFSLAFGLVVRARQGWYRLFKPKPLPVPILIVGNIAVGGSGKTPVVVAIAQALKEQGFYPAVISRGYGGQRRKTPHIVKAADSVKEVGDEPLLIHKKTNLPVVVGPKRVQCVKTLLHHFPEVDVILSDDGLQHYRLWRFKEIAMVDPSVLGNGRLLPEGPLRESLKRLQNVDYRLGQGPLADYHLSWKTTSIYPIEHPEQAIPLSQFCGRKVHAIAGIARPKRFFETLKQHGLIVDEHPFPDHHNYQVKDLDFKEDYPILMTEKDAIKCCGIDKPIWVVSYEAQLPSTFMRAIMRDLYDRQKTA